MRDLIERLERATGPDRELDMRIWWLLDRKSAERTYWNAATGKPRALGDELPTSGLGVLAMKERAPHYTASLDAALTLVPAGLDWFVKHYASAGGKFGAVVTSPEIAARSWGDYSHDNSPTPALALCIAALRAREAAK